MLRVTFDSNVWEHVVSWEAYKDDTQQDRVQINHAIRDGLVSAFISERILTVEAIKKKVRGETLVDLTDNYIQVEDRALGDGRIEMTYSFDAISNRHPGPHPILADRLRLATALGFRVIPDFWFGSSIPKEPDLSPFYVQTADHEGRTLDEILTEEEAITEEMVKRGVGRGRVEQLGERIRKRLGMADGSLYDGLDRPKDDSEMHDIAHALGEMVDGNIVSAHIAYHFDLLCSHDQGRGRPSIFEPQHRQWLAERYGVTIVGVRELAERIRALPPA